MNANDYQEKASRTLIDAPEHEITVHQWAVVWAGMQLAKETGKMIDHLKKAIFHQHGYDPDESFSALSPVYDSYMDLVRTIHDGANSWPFTGELAGRQKMAIWTAFGLAGEAGEIMEALEHYLETGETDRLKDELSDQEWYIAATCETVGLKLSDVLEHNVAKLKKRYPDGWDAVKSKERSE